MKSLSHKIYLVVIMLIITNCCVMAQGYSNSPGDSVHGKIRSGGRLVLNISQIHPGHDTLYLKWKKLAASIPAGWDVSICDYEHCYLTLMDSGTMSPLVPGDDALMSMHFFDSGAPGVAIIRYTLTSKATPQHTDTLTWIVDGSLSAIENAGKDQPLVSVYPDKLNIHCQATQFAEVNISDIQGRILFTSQLKNAENIEIPLQGFTTGMYVLHLRGAYSVFSQKILIRQ